MAFLLSGHLVLISLIFLPVVPCSYGPDLATWMQDGESGVFLEDHSYTTIWSTVGRSPLSRMWLCLGRKSRNFKCHKTRRHTSMMILLLMLSGDVEINPGPVTGRNQQKLGGDMKKDAELPPSDPSSKLPPVSPQSEDERSMKLRQVYKSLESFYSSQLRTVQCAPDVEFVKLVTVEREYHRTKYKKEIEEFLQASIHGIDGYCESSEKIEYEDILNCGEVISGKRVLISGAPGCGKTTLSRKLCKDLYSQSLPNQYHLVLLVELRWLRLWLDKVKEDIDLQFLFMQYQDILDTSDLCKLLKRNSGEGVALILDGFDEIADQLGNSRFFADLLSVDSPYLCKCDVVITTRPSRCHDLISLIQRPSRRVEILGFTNTGIVNYIESFCMGVCKKDARRALCMINKMLKNLISRPLLPGICRIPRALEILCKVNEYLGSSPLPETRSGLFSTYICHQLVNYLETLTERMPSICVEDVLHVPEDRFPGFYSLCEVAYKCCIDKTGQRLILTVDDLGDVMRYLDKQGSIYNLLFSEEASPISGVLYQFNHKTVQETLAAIHIARLNEDHQMFWEEHFCQPEMAEVWIIYCGLTKLKHINLKELSYSVLSQHAREVVDQELFRDDDMVVMTSLFEADDSSLSRKILEDLIKTSFTADARSSYEAQVVRYSLQHHPTPQRFYFGGDIITESDELMPILMPHLRELRCDQLREEEWKTLSKAFVKAQHLETIQLPMLVGVDKHDIVPSQVEVVLSALTKLPTLKTFKMDMSLFSIQIDSKGLQEDCRRIIEALEAKNCLREFHLKDKGSNFNPGVSIFTELLCRNETLSEVIIDSYSEHVNKVPVQLLKSLLVHREKCTLRMALTHQQWCAVLSGLRDAKKLKELVVFIYSRLDRSSIPDQSDQCLISSDEVEELVATSKQLMKVEVCYDPMLEAVGDLVLSMVKGVSRNKNISELGVVIEKGAGFSSDHDNYLDRARSVVVPILEILAVHTNHITCVRFECATIPLLTLLGDDWCQLLVDGPMSRRECHLKLVLTPVQCWQLLSRVNDAKGLEELTDSVIIYLGSTIHEGHCSVCNDATLKAVEGVYSNCKLRKMRHQFDFEEEAMVYIGGCTVAHVATTRDWQIVGEDSISLGRRLTPSHWEQYQTNLLVAVVRGIVSNANDIDFVLGGSELKGDDIMSQLPPQSVERFEVVKRRGWGFIISKPCAPTVAKRKLPLQASSPLSPTMSVGVTQATNKSSSPSSTRVRLSQLSVSSRTKSRIPLPTSSTSSLIGKIGIGLATEKSPSLSQLSQTQISSVMCTKSTPSASVRCSTERGPPTSNPTFQKKSENKDVIKSHSDLLPYIDKMLAHLPLLGAVLGVEDYTSAVMKEPGDPQSRCIDILSHWIKVTPHPTWTMFCDRLKRNKTFNNLRSKICRDKSVRYDL